MSYRNHRAEKYNNCTEDTRCLQYRTRWNRRKDHSHWRQGSGSHPIRAAKRKRMRKGEKSLKDLRIMDNFKWTNISITGLTEEEERGKRAGILFEEIMTENLFKENIWKNKFY